MIELISSNNVALVLDPKTKIRVEWNSAIFNEDSIQGDIVYWFDIPMYPTNVKELGHANIPGMSNKVRVLDFTLKLLGSISMTGKLIVSTVTDKFRCSFTTNNLQAYKEKLLNTISFGSSISLGSTQQDVIDHADGKKTQTYPSTNYVFPVIKNEELYGDDNPAYVGYMNHYDFENSEYYQNYLDAPDEDEEAPDGIINKYPLVPQFFLQFVLDKLFTAIGYDHFGDFITGTNYQQLLLFNAFCLDDNLDNYWIEFSGGSKVSGYEVLLEFSNRSYGSAMSGSSHYQMTLQHVGWHQFKFKMWCHADSVTHDLISNLSCDGEGTGKGFSNVVTIPHEECLNDEIVENIHTVYVDADMIGLKVTFGINNTAYWDVVDAEASMVNISQTNLNRYAKTLYPENHIPAVQINEFLNGLRKFWQMAIIMDSQNAQAEFLFLKDLFDTKSVDFTDKIAKGQELESINDKTITVDFDWDKDDNFLDTNQYNDQGDFDQYLDLPTSRDIADIATMNPANAIYKVFYIDFQNIWKRFTDIDQKCTYGDGDETDEIEINIHPTFMTGYIHSETRGESQFLFAIPMVNKQGKSKMFNSENDEDPVLKLMDWQAMGDFEKLDENTGTYPFATSHNVDSKGVSTGRKSLFLKGTGSVGEDFHADWLNWLKSTESYVFNGGANFKTATLQKLLKLIKPQKGVSIANQERWMMIESVNYLPKQITAEISMQGLESVEIKGVKKGY